MDLDKKKDDTVIELNNILADKAFPVKDVYDILGALLMQVSHSVRMPTEFVEQLCNNIAKSYKDFMNLQSELNEKTCTKPTK